MQGEIAIRSDHGFVHGFRIRFFRPLALALVALFVSIGLAAVGFAESGPTPQKLISAIETAFGITPGQRRNHIKGTCASGVFVANASGARFSRSALFSGKEIPVVARFSLAGGKLKAPDTTRNPRGLGLQFQLPGDQKLNMAMLSTPVFGAATEATARQVRLVSAQEMRRLIWELVPLVDARSAQAFMRDHLPGAIDVPLIAENEQIRRVHPDPKQQLAFTATL